MERESLNRWWRGHPRDVGIALAVLISVTSTRPVAAQMKLPEKFENLQVLPKDIPKGDLVRIMKEFTSALGVRCEYCHVEAEGEDAFKFASDDKENKKTARIMMQMVQDINAKWMAKVPRERPDQAQRKPATENRESGSKGGDKDSATSRPESVAEASSAEMRVRCVTCHHGLSHPTTIDDEMRETMASDGLPAAVEKYKELRKKYYGGFQYDFTERPLNRMATRMIDSGKTDDALSLLQLNAEMNPDSGMVHFLRGEAYSAQGDKAEAIKSYKKALELMPKLEAAREKLDALEKGK